VDNGGGVWRCEDDVGEGKNRCHMRAQRGAKLNSLNVAVDAEWDTPSNKPMQIFR